MFKYLVTLSLVFNLSTSAFGAGSAKLIDFLISGSGVGEILAKKGITGTDSKQVQSYVAAALGSLSSKKNLTNEDFKKIIADLPVSKKDETVKKELQVLFDKPEKEINQAELVKAINHIIYLSRNNKSVIITCADCESASLSKLGFKFGVETVKNASLVKVLNDVVPTNAKDINTFIASKARLYKFGDYSKVSPEMVSPAEEKSLAIFFALVENGNADQKALTNAIKRISTKNGKTDMFDAKSTQKFWKILSDDMSPQDMNGWTKTLNEVAGRAERDGVNPEEAFYRTLKEKAQGNDYLMKQFETLKAKRCFFK